jgi:hypothetical protein
MDHDGSRTHGFFARVGYRKTARGWRPRESKYFGDATYGGRAAALKAAQRWVKATRKALAAR